MEWNLEKCQYKVQDDTYFANNESSELENRSARLCKETAVTSVSP